MSVLLRATAGPIAPAVLGLVAAVAIGPAHGDDTRPNVIVVLADDLGPGDLAYYGGKTPTPNIDRMAREGIKFTRYYTPSPICSPSRCGTITGQFPGRWKITTYLQTKAGNRACGQADFLDPEAPSLPRALKAAGYKTAHIGKWHLGGGRDVVNPPKFAAYGYDLGLGTWESPEPHADITAGDWIWSADDKVKRWERSAWMVDRALEFLKARRDDPCFVNLWLDDPHTPWVPTAADQAVDKNGRATGKGQTPERLAKVLVELDKQVGRLLDAVRAKKDGRPTLVLFLSDNGPLPSFDRARTGGQRGSKLSLFEGGIRVPLIAWGPGLVPAGQTNETTVLWAIDFFPTFCRLCDAPLPKGYRPDGEDLSAALLSKAPKRTTRMFWEYGRNATAFDYPKGKDKSPNVAVLDGDWKLLVNADGTGAELYDLSADPKEADDVSATYPDTAKRLKEAALAWRAGLP